MIPVVFCWSGGKDSAYALHQVFKEGRYTVKYLLSTINGNSNRLSMHGVKEELIQEQADSIGIPLLKVYVYEANNSEYEKQMEKTLLTIKAEGISTVLFGDIFLEDLRQYREQKMQPLKMDCVFPLWKMDTGLMVRDFIKQGFKTYTCCVNDGYLDESWVGRLIDGAFVDALPQGTDPCGENGEFHSFCFDGPVFKRPIQVRIGEKKYEPLLVSTGLPTSLDGKPVKGFWYADIVPQ